MRVLITGGAGFIGCHLVTLLTAIGHEVTVFDALVPQVHGQNPPWPEAVAGVDHVFGDVRSTSHLTEVLTRKRPQVIVHLAAKVGVGQAEYEFDSYIDHNVTGMACLLRSILNANDTVENVEDGVQRLVLAGSMSSYGEGDFYCPTHKLVRVVMRDPCDLLSAVFSHKCPYQGCEQRLEEALPLFEFSYQNCRGAYAQTKADQERYGQFFADSHGMSFATARLFNVYGPGQALSNPYTGVAAIFAARCLKGERPVVFEDGLQVRDFVHVSDVALAFAGLVGDPVLKLARRMWQSQRADGPFNVSTGEATTVLQVAKFACEALAPALEPEVTQRFRVADIRGCLGNWQRIQDAIGWAPKVAPGEGFPALFASFGEQHRLALKDVDLDVAQRELEARRMLTTAPIPDTVDEDGQEVPDFEREETRWGE